MEKNYIDSIKSEKQKVHINLKLKDIHPVKISKGNINKICNIPFNYVNGQFMYKVNN